MDQPDLTGAHVFVEAARPESDDRWHVLPNGTVVYERRPGEYEPSIIAASTITNSPSWADVTGDR